MKQLIKHPAMRERIKEIIRESVCQVYGISVGDMCRKSKKREIVDARKVTAFILFDLGICKSVKEISPEIGLCRNSGYNVLFCFRELLKYDPTFRRRYERALELIGERVGELRDVKDFRTAADESSVF